MVPSDWLLSPSSEPRVVAIVQARLGSTRFPRKVLSPLGGVPALRFLLDRLSRAKTLSEIVVAIPDTSPESDLEVSITSWGFQVFRGDENDVLDRYVGAAQAFDADVVVRVTGDCPFIDPHIVDALVELHFNEDADFASTSKDFPDGFDVAVAPAESLVRAAIESDEAFDREHVMPWVIRNAKHASVLPCPAPFPQGRVTLDEPEDLRVLQGALEALSSDEFLVEDVVHLMKVRPELFEDNAHLLRDEGSLMSNGQKMWRRANRVIPAGNMLLSKRPQQFSEEDWPTYFARARGCEVVDLDGRSFLDLSLMGVGTNILGYGHPKVDEAVTTAIKAGNLSTLNCPEEVALAERLCGIHPWADMVKFARTGGEACAIAVRIARAATAKPAVAVCGYHGWHDWYLSANLGDDNALDGHLLPGLEPIGVPRELKGLTRPFFYNDLAALERILSAGDVGVVMMEVERSTPPQDGFLEGVRNLTSQHGAVLIFDECTSGFRKNFGGLHLVHGVEPDLATFGKTLGNGYAITAVIGREVVMRAAEKTFISSTFWTDRIGPAAALAALDAMIEEEAPQRINRIGEAVRAIWRSVFESVQMEVSWSGLPALTSFTVPRWDQVEFRRRLVTLMLDRGFLAGPAVYSSIAHSPDVLDRYQTALAEAVGMLVADQEGLLSRDTDTGVGGRGFGRLA